MGFSAIIPATEAAAANAALETQGFGQNNFSVPLVGDNPDEITHYGMNVGGNVLDFHDAVAAIPAADIRDTEPGEVTFDEHAAALGLARVPEDYTDQGLPE